MRSFRIIKIYKKNQATIHQANQTEKTKNYSALISPTFTSHTDPSDYYSSSYSNSNVSPKVPSPTCFKIFDSITPQACQYICNKISTPPVYIDYIKDIIHSLTYTMKYMWINPHLPIITQQENLDKNSGKTTNAVSWLPLLKYIGFIS